MSTTECQFVDIGVYSHYNRAAVEESLLPVWRLLLDGKRVSHWRFFGGYTVNPNSNIRLRPEELATNEIVKTPRAYAEWQRSLTVDICAQLRAPNALPAVLVGNGPSTAWVVLGRAMSHCAQRPILVNNSPSGQLEVFDFRRVDAWWLWPQQCVRKWYYGPLLRPVQTKLREDGSEDDALHRAAIVFVTHDDRYKLGASEQQFIEQHLQSQGFSARVVVDVRPTTPLLKVKQVDLLALSREMDAIVRDAQHRFGRDNRLDAVAVVSTGPAPLAFIVGGVLRENLHGALLTYERKALHAGATGLEPAFDSRRVD